MEIKYLVHSKQRIFLLYLFCIAAACRSKLVQLTSSPTASSSSSSGISALVGVVPSD